MTRILVTGGAGFIGSHTCVTLLQEGYEVLVLDNLSNGSPESLTAIEKVSGGKLVRICSDIRDTVVMSHIFDQGIDAVIHFAGLKAVGESVEKSLEYWDVNVGGTLSLLRAMAASTCRTIVFSSSATLYGEPESVPIPETAKLQPVNPYGETKLAIEQILSSLPSHWNVASLRYFNPVGAHPSGLLGEDPHGIPQNLFPFVTQVAVGRRPFLQVFGGDYDTPDGTCVRDYIHVMDLAEGHIAALRYLKDCPGKVTLNLGSGIGHSVKDVIRTFQRVTGKAVTFEVVERRAGDVKETVADASKAEKLLGWKTTRTLDDMCRDGWNWQVKNPDGYGTTHP